MFNRKVACTMYLKKKPKNIRECWKTECSVYPAVLFAMEILRAFGICVQNNCIENLEGTEKQH